MTEDMLQTTAPVSMYAHLLVCPACKGKLDLRAKSLACSNCSTAFPIQSGIPLLSWSRDQEDPDEKLTARVRSFYETNPFPDYEGTEDVASLLQKARSSVFARLLDEQMPFGVRVLECGCGTGQLSNFLGIAHRTVFGSDLSLSSLRLADEFRKIHNLDRVFFLQMNLFFPVFPANSFDYVISNGVLHHTFDPRQGFELLSSLVRPGGYLIVGLYHRFGRLPTDIRRQLFRISGNRFAFLDPRIRRSGLGRQRRTAWYEDQYRNPHESKHTVSEVLKWLDRAGLRFVKSIPKTRLSGEFSANEELFRPEPPGSALERLLSEMSLALRSDPEGGFFTVIAQKVT
jgi:SAM-dependent methyltransferase